MLDRRMIKKQMPHRRKVLGDKKIGDMVSSFRIFYLQVKVFLKTRLKIIIYIFHQNNS